MDRLLELIMMLAMALLPGSVAQYPIITMPNQYINQWYYNQGTHARSLRSVYVPTNVKINVVAGTKHSHWTKWSPWSDCSKTCAGGVKTRTRICKGEKMPYEYKDESNSLNEVEYKCKGNARDFDACNTEPCISTRTFRKMKHKSRLEQCSAYNKIPYFSDLYEWLPYLRDGLEECKLNCLANNFKMFKSFGNVADKTICGRSYGHHCINGKCVKKIAEEKKPEDTNVTENITTPTQSTTPKRKVIYIIKQPPQKVQWTHIQRSFKMKKFVSDIAKAFIIPIKAVNVTIKETEPSKNLLILKSFRQDLVNGRSWVKKSRDIFYEGSTITYNDGRNNSGKETIFIQGPLKTNLFLDVQYNGSASDINYEYALPSENTNYLNHVSRRRFYNPLNPQVQSFYQQYSNQQYPTLTFPFNRQPNQRVISKISKQNNVNANQIISQNQREPTFTKNQIPGPASQQQQQKGQQSRIINGLPVPSGVNRQVIHGRNLNVHKGANSQIPSRFIGQIPLGINRLGVHHQVSLGNRQVPRKINGQNVQLGNNQPIPQIAINHQISAGIDPRLVSGVNSRVFPGNNRIVPPGINPHIRPGINRQGSQALNNQQKTNKDAIYYKWQIGGFTNCTRTCGGGEQEVVYRCFEAKGMNQGKFVSGTMCNKKDKPTTSKRICNARPCPYKWKTWPWSECTKRCGINRKRTRRVRCTQKRYIVDRALETNVDVKFCRLLEKPAEEERCTYKPCNYRWYTGRWTACSKTCDRGIQTRNVQCKHKNGFVLNDRNCDATYKPNATRACLRRYCKVGWFASEWSECSSQCGSGIQHRYVICSSSNGDFVDERQCENQNKPIEKKSCRGTVCEQGVWITTEWSKCSNGCGAGQQSRSVFCLQQQSHNLIKVVSDYKCNARNKPKEKKQCLERTCQPLWHVNQWDQCDCKKGFQRRYRVCLATDRSKARGCMWESRPNLLRKCSNQCIRIKGLEIEVSQSEDEDSHFTTKSTKKSHDDPSGHATKRWTYGKVAKTTQTPKLKTTLPVTTAKLKTNAQPREKNTDTTTQILPKTSAKTKVTSQKTKLITETKQEAEKILTRPEKLIQPTIIQSVTTRIGTTTQQPTKKSSTTIHSVIHSTESTLQPTTTTQPTTTSTTTTSPLTTTIQSTTKRTTTSPKTTTTTTTTTTKPKRQSSSRRNLIRPFRPFRGNSKRCFDLHSKGFCYAVKRHKMCKKRRLKMLCCKSCSKG